MKPYIIILSIIAFIGVIFYFIYKSILNLIALVLAINWRLAELEEENED